MRLFALSMIVSIGFLVLSVRATRRHRLREHIAMLWLGVSLAMVFLSATLPFHLLDRAAHFVGIAYPPDLILLIAVLFLFAFTFQLSMSLARLSEKNTKVAQEIGILSAHPAAPTHASTAPFGRGRDRQERETDRPSSYAVVADVGTVGESTRLEVEQKLAVPPDDQLPVRGVQNAMCNDSRLGSHQASSNAEDQPLPSESAGTSFPSMRPRMRWWTSFALLFLLIEAWSLATPLMASPDEPAHTIKAAAVVRGELFGLPAHPTAMGPSPEIAVHVPEVFSGLGVIPTCYAFQPSVPASCAPIPGSSAREVNVATTAGRYEPLYYSIVGLPSLVFPSGTGIWLMRLVSGLLSALFLASALESAAACKKRRLLVWGVAVAATPMVMFMAGTINPNGLEVSAAICLWASGFALLSDDETVPNRRLLARVGIAASVLVQVRGLSPLWLLLIALSLVVLAGKQKLAELSRDRVARAWAGALAVSCAFAVWWLVRFDPLALQATPIFPTTHVSGITLLTTSVGYSEGFVQEMIGVLGWLDVSLPLVTYFGWLALVFILMGLGLLLGGRKHLGVLIGLVVLILALPVILDAANARNVGFVWQGRYTLPLAVGIPIVAAGAVANRWCSGRLLQRAAILFPVILVMAESALFFDALRRYTVGLGNSFDVFSGPWHPPFGTVAVSVAFVVIVIAYAAWLRVIATQSPVDVGTMTTSVVPEEVS